MLPLLLAAGTDVTPEASVLAALPHWAQIALMVLGAVVPVASFVASFLSQYVRTKRQRGERVPAWMLALVSATNAAAMNPHKAARAAKAAKEQP